jgi:hypothetical protein
MAKSWFTFNNSTGLQVLPGVVGYGTGPVSAGRICPAIASWKEVWTEYTE